MSKSTPLINTYTQQAAPNAQRQAANVQFAPVANNLGQGLAAAAAAMLALQDRADKLKMQNYDQTLNREEKEFARQLLADNNPDNFDGKFKEYERRVKEIGMEALGGRLYSKWLQETGDSYLKAVAQNTNFAKEDALKMQSRQLLKTNLENYATEASLAESSTERMAADELANIAIKDALYPKDGGPAIINEQQAQELREYHRRSSDLAFVKRDLREAPQTALENLNNAKEYTGLMPVERQRFIEEAQREIKAREGTIRDAALQEVLNNFNIIYEANNDAAYKEYQAILDNRASAQKKYKLNPTQLTTAINYMKSAFEEGSAGLAAEELYADVKIKYNKFEIDKTTGKIENSRMNNVEDVVDLVSVINGNLAEGRLDRNRAGAVEMVANLRRSLGDMVEEHKPNIRDKAGWFRQSVSEAIPRQIAAYLSERIQGGDLPKEAKGQIYEDVYTNAKLRQVPLSSYALQDKEVIGGLIRDAVKRNISAQYMLAPEEANAVLSSEGVLVEYAPGAPKNKDAAAVRGEAKYQTERNAEGGSARVRRDADNNIIDVFTPAAAGAARSISNLINEEPLWKASKKK